MTNSIRLKAVARMQRSAIRDGALAKVPDSGATRLHPGYGLRAPDVHYVLSAFLFRS